ncbi:hypothetical protein GCM10011375_02380 [Hymenobacter qilianensis]|uniref:Uncharacterized protein n=1 Tax=Hymenobacter qilianensis TaxID=1385715 RepID=A0ACB5PLG8_9BACT|nr:hypothetical protein GCM10011375_02380 [Hymenobacter qilianensis]
MCLSNAAKLITFVDSHRIGVQEGERGGGNKDSIGGKKVESLEEAAATQAARQQLLNSQTFKLLN